MNQPPACSGSAGQWRRPPGVAPGTWDYTHERSIADHYDRFVAETPLCRLDATIVEETFASVAAGATVLDLGCGTGRIAIELASMGHHVVAVDLSQPMLRVLQSKQAPGRLKGTILPLRANIVELDCLISDCCDHAVCLFSTLGMVQGRQHRRRLLEHASRVVRPGGRLLLHVHARWSGLREHRGIRSLVRGWWKSLTDKDHEFGDSTYDYRGIEQMFMHRFSLRELRADLRSAGWTVQRIDRISIDGARIQTGPRIDGGFLIVAIANEGGTATESHERR